MIHIIAQEVRTTTQFHHSHRIGILRIDIRTTMIGRHHTTTQFTGKVRILLITLIQTFFLFTKLFCGNSCRRTESLEVKGLIVISSRLFDTPFPKAVGIIAIKGQHLSERHRGSQLWPSCTRIERQVETYLLGYPFQRHQVRTMSTILVIKLGSHHRTTIFPLKALKLSEDLTIQTLHKTEEHRILVPRLTTLRKHPVRDASVSYLSMTERA